MAKFIGGKEPMDGLSHNGIYVGNRHNTTLPMAAAHARPSSSVWDVEWWESRRGTGETGLRPNGEKASRRGPPSYLGLTQPPRRFRRPCRGRPRSELAAGWS